MNGFKELRHRPWPSPASLFRVVNISPRWLDLCYVRPTDGAVVYLCSMPNPNYTKPTVRATPLTETH